MRLLTLQEMKQSSFRMQNLEQQLQQRDAKLKSHAQELRAAQTGKTR